MRVALRTQRSRNVDRSGRSLRHWTLGVAAAALVCCGLPVAAEDVDFQRDVLPILNQHCTDCHGRDEAESKLRLDSMLAALRGGNSGEPVVVPGSSGRSHLVERITSKDADQRMPPDSPPLDEKHVRTLRAWIDSKPLWRDAQAKLAAQRVDHWSFHPVDRPQPPRADAHPVDAFIDARLAARGLQRTPPATRRRLIRRAYLVLLGVPPTPAEIKAFENDRRPDAWQQVVQRLLADRRYGERLATLWLDLISFGETHGYETNRERPAAWRYRDWVIQAFNDDKPYDRFIVEQIAGDAVGEPLGTGFLVAGPYDLVKGQDAKLRLMQRQDELAGMINTTGTALLGLTLGCARCHNHKFDPVSQTDYYSLQAVFAGVNHAERALPLTTKDRKRIAALDMEVAGLRKSLARFDRAAHRDSSKPLRPAVTARHNVEEFPAVAARFVRFTIQATSSSQPCIDELEIFAGDDNVALASAGAKATSGGDFVHPLHKLEHINDGRYGNSRSWIASQVSGGWVQIELPREATVNRIEWARDRQQKYSDRVATDYKIEASRDGKQWRLLAGSADRAPYSKKPKEPTYDFAGVPPAEADAGRRQLERLKALVAERAAVTRSASAYVGTFSQPGPTRRLYRGEPDSPRETVVPAAITSLSKLRLPADAPEQRRRLAIAKWIADPQNPLTARVIVNRIWQFHFGTGIVDTPSDFGGNGSRPTHPELLDWLAAELVSSDWSLKHIHNLILMSATWQQDSVPNQSGLRTDAASRLLWRFPPRRLEAEGIRDCILAVSGKLDPRPGGPGFSGFEVQPENVRHYFPKKDFGPADWRRMIYMTRVRQEREGVFGVFDCPDFSQVVPRRTRSTTPLQALNLLNSRFVMQQAGFLAERLSGEAKTDEQRVVLAYELCFGRRPTAGEVREALEFVGDTGWREFARAMLNANEFVFIP